MARDGFLKSRSTGELLVLMVAATVCGSVIVGGGAIILLAVFRPGVDTGAAARNIADLLNTLVGLLAGFLAGRTDMSMQQHRDAQRAAEERETQKQQILTQLKDQP
jgi:uncharacterized membrane protein YccC